jgi:preprotein translocase subunit SecD
MAVDASVLIFERLKEELRNGKTLRAAIDAGFHRALTTIIDSNVTTIIAAVVLLYFGSGPIKGFAVTLIIGILTSMFTAITITRVILVNLINAKLFTNKKLYGV